MHGASEQDLGAFALSTSLKSGDYITGETRPLRRYKYSPLIGELFFGLSLAVETEETFV